MKILITAIIVLCSVTAFAKEHYVFDSKEKAEQALAMINSDSVFPIVGRNAATGELEPNKQLTVRWVDEVKEKNNEKGKYYFPRIPKKWRDQQSLEKTNGFKANFPHVIKEFKKEWQPEEVEI